MLVFGFQVTTIWARRVIVKMKRKLYLGCRRTAVRSSHRTKGRRRKISPKRAPEGSVLCESVTEKVRRKAGMMNEDS